MQIQLQTALASYLQGRATTLGEDLLIVASATREEQEPRTPAVIVGVRSFSHIAGPATGDGGIYQAEIALTLETPVLPAADTSGHAAAETLLLSLLPDPPDGTLATALLAQGLVLCGQLFQGWEELPTPAAWGTVALWSLGLQVTTPPEPPE